MQSQCCYTAGIFPVCKLAVHFAFNYCLTIILVAIVTVTYNHCILLLSHKLTTNFCYRNLQITWHITVGNNSLFVWLFGGVKPEIRTPPPLGKFGYNSYILILIERNPPPVGVSYLIKNPEKDVLLVPFIEQGATWQWFVNTKIRR